MITLQASATINGQPVERKIGDERAQLIRELVGLAPERKLADRGPAMAVRGLERIDVFSLHGEILHEFIC